jgi:peptidoglycan hydrolase-like protein with peptidoglycan-binding domain
MKRSLRVLCAAATVASLGLAACSSSPTDQAELGRKLAEEAKASIQAIDAEAHNQKIDPAVVKKVQEQLTVLKEYMGPINGRLDPVTLNAFEAFQRSQGMAPDGMFTPRALELLAQEAGRQGASS